MEENKPKYTAVIINTIITQIAKTTDIEGYSEGVIEIFFPDDDLELTEEESQNWIDENNNRMEAICNFLNNTYKK